MKPAVASDDPVIVRGDDKGVFSRVQTSGHPGSTTLRTTPADSAAPACSYTEIAAFAPVMQAIGKDEHAGQDGGYFLWDCGGNRDGVDWFAAGAPPPAQITAGQLARQASSLLTIPAPEPRMAPDRDPAPGRYETVVNLHTWLWLDGQSWTTRSRTTAVPGLAVTVTATPTSAEWDLGQGTATCGAGTPFRVDRAKSGSPDCDYTFRRATAGYPGTVVSDWRVTWAATDGETGVLADEVRVTPVVVAAREYAAVLVE